uniref:Uncharacterized protein n=1 Tax=Cacopsylla melanoneura TaxID=428564 RepID=A0A8D8T4U4_9HEMI
MIMIHVEGQIKILCSYIEMLGCPHKDSEGNRIFYKQFETNSYVLASSILTKHPSTSCKTTQEVKFLNRINLRMMRAYEQDYFKQLVRFHQKVRTFMEQIFDEIPFIVLLVVISNYMNISFTLYQLIVYTGHQSNGKLFKFLAELILTLVQFGTYCNTAERWDSCHARMRASLYTSQWYTCSTQTRKDMCMLLSRLRKPNYPRFYQGVIEISNPMFVRFVNVCYKAVNVMKITSSRG